MIRSIIEVIIYMTSIPQYLPSEDLCNKNIDHLELKAQIEFSIGCSSVNGRKLYSHDRLNEVYTRGK